MTGRPEPLRLLILGGTGEAAALARAAAARFGDAVDLTSALAGRTTPAGPLPGLVRIGGFGGATGLASYLREWKIDRLIDATHPFAAEISAAAREACDLAAIPRLMLLRPPWRRHPLDRWIEVSSLEAAAAVVARLGRRTCLTVGAGSIGAFASVAHVQFLVRLLEAPRQPLALPQYEVVVGRGPFSLAEERHLLQHHAIDVLVCKASGGTATEAKLIAARELSLPVVMVRRPRPEPGLSAETVEAALDWLAEAGSLPAVRRMS